MWDLRWSSINSRLLGWFLLLALLPLGVLAFLSVSRSARSLEEDVRIHMAALAEQKAAHVEKYAIERQRDVTLLSREPTVIEALSTLTSVFVRFGLRSREYADAAGAVRPYFQNLVEVSGYTDLFLISADGHAVFSIKEGEDLGSSYLTGPYKDSELARVFDDARTLLSTEISDFDFYPATNEPAAFIGAPILKEGSVIGVVALQMNNEEVYHVVQDPSGGGQTGETVVAGLKGSHAVVMTPLRHDPDAAFRRRIPMGGAEENLIQEAVQGLATEGHYTDYRGKKVYAVTRYLPSLRWGMAIKMDDEEAFQRVHRERRALAIVAGGMLLLIFFACIVVARSISDPVTRLTASVRRISAGHMNEAVLVSGHDEIAELSVAFNKMIEDLRRLMAEALERQRMEQELRLAREIQVALLPSSLPTLPGYEIHAGNVPSRGVSGDFCKLSLRSDGRECVIFEADVSGKGMAAALLTASLEALLAVPLESGQPPEVVCDLVSAQLLERTPVEKYATAFLGVLELETGRLRYVNAGHNAALLLRADGEPEWLKSNGFPMGLWPGTRYTTVETELAKGDLLLVYTDGITEATNAKKEEFGSPRLLAASRTHRHLVAREFALALDREVELFVGAEPFSDDRTVVVVKRLS